MLVTYFVPYPMMEFRRCCRYQRECYNDHIAMVRGCSAQLRDDYDYE
jgi:hypothetical protein